MRRSIKALALLLSLVLALAVFGGCASQKAVKSEPEETGQTKASEQAKSEETVKTPQGPEELKLPIVDKPLTLTWFGVPEAFITDIMKDYNDMATFKEAEKRTGIHIDFNLATSTNFKEKLGLTLATQETEDMMWDAWMAQGGPSKLVEDGSILKLNDLIDQYAPNFKKLLDSNPELRKQISLDDGTIYMFPEVRLDPVTRTNSGFQIRQDWLDALGLQVPTTIDEWYTVLKAFKEKDPNGNGQPDEIPFLSMSVNKSSQYLSNFSVAWGMIDSSSSFYIDNGKVKFAALEPAYKDYVATMKKWYEEGLIDSEYTSVDAKNFDAKVTGNRTGSYLGPMSGTLGRYSAIMKDDPKFKLGPAPWPKAPDGKSYSAHDAFVKMAPHGVSIGANNKHIKETIKWIDYHYSPEGHKLFNWGIQGEAHEEKDGKLQLTDLVLKNPENLSIEQAVAKYAGGTICQMPVVNDSGIYTQIKLGLPQQREASKVWGSGSAEKLVPPVTVDPKDSAEFASIMSEVKTFKEETFDKMIMGLEPVENIDKHVETLKKMGIEKAISIYQKAFDSYNKK